VTLLNVAQNVSLQPYNTLGIYATARYFALIETIEQLHALLESSEYAALPRLILGSGSNILFTHDFPGLVLRMQIQGIQKIIENSDFSVIEVNAGELWENVVEYALDQGYGGIENLTWIPGTAGAGPVQNIGAYGVELKDTLENVTVYDTNSHQERIFPKEQCCFGYRSSIFKTNPQYIILKIQLQLTKHPELQLQYASLTQAIQTTGQTPTNIREVAQLIRKIRDQRLPNPKILGNAGSFFKNPQIPLVQYQKLQAKYPKIVGYPASEDQVKIAAGWLIEQAGWKGKRIGNVGTYAHQALVMIAYPGATGQAILSFAQEIQHSVQEQFGISLEPEVLIV